MRKALVHGPQSWGERRGADGHVSVHEQLAVGLLLEKILTGSVGLEQKG